MNIRAIAKVVGVPFLTLWLFCNNSTTVFMDTLTGSAQGNATAGIFLLLFTYVVYRIGPDFVENLQALLNDVPKEEKPKTYINNQNKL